MKAGRMADWTHVQIDGHAVIVNCCPACDAPVASDNDDGGGSHCPTCKWRGDGYATGAPWYPATVQRVKPWPQIPEFLSGGRVVERRYVAESS